jgi:hypothetical protein
MHLTDYLVHFSNVLMLVAYSVTDILWLRWFAVAAALTNIPYFLMQPTRLWPPVMWACIFTIINLCQIVRIYMQRRPVALSEDEQALYDLAFRTLRPREFVSLALIGEWKTATAGESVLTAGQAVSAICVPISGTVRVHREGKDVAVLDPGHLIGTGLALTGDPSPVDATFTTTARYMCWPLQSLRSFIDRRPDLRFTLQGLVNRDLAFKLGQAMLARSGEATA